MKDGQGRTKAKKNSDTGKQMKLSQMFTNKSATTTRYLYFMHACSGHCQSVCMHASVLWSPLFCLQCSPNRCKRENEDEEEVCLEPPSKCSKVELSSSCSSSFPDICKVTSSNGSLEKEKFSNGKTEKSTEIEVRGFSVSFLSFSVYVCIYCVLC